MWEHTDSKIRPELVQGYNITGTEEFSGGRGQVILFPDRCQFFSFFQLGGHFHLPGRILAFRFGSVPGSFAMCLSSADFRISHLQVLNSIVKDLHA